MDLAFILMIGKKQDTKVSNNWVRYEAEFAVFGRVGEIETSSIYKNNLKMTRKPPLVGEIEN